MPRSFRWLAVASLVALAAAPAQAQTTDVTADPTSLLWGRQFTEWFFTGEADSIFVRMDAANQQQAGSAANIRGFLAQVQQQGGNEEEILSEEVKTDSTGMYRYIRRARFSNAPEMVIKAVWVLSPDRKIAGFGLRPEEREGS
jgi:hypothetical protein